MPAALEVVEIGLGKTFPSVAVAMLCTLVTLNVLMGGKSTYASIWRDRHTHGNNWYTDAKVDSSDIGLGYRYDHHLRSKSRGEPTI